MTEEQRQKLFEARGHLGAALVQMIPSDDQIIRERVQEAYDLLGELARELTSATFRRADRETPTIQA